MVNAHFWTIRAGHRSAKRVTTWLLLALFVFSSSKITGFAVGRGPSLGCASEAIVLTEPRSPRSELQDVVGELVMIGTKPVMPANPRLRGDRRRLQDGGWIPACAGMTAICAIHATPRPPGEFANSILQSPKRSGAGDLRRTIFIIPTGGLCTRGALPGAWTSPSTTSPPFVPRSEHPRIRTGLTPTGRRPGVPCSSSQRDLDVYAQEPEVEIKLTAPEPPPGGWTVGDPIQLRLTATYPAGFDLALPALPQQWGPFEVIEQSALPPTDDAPDRLRASRDVVVTLWAPGDYQTPPLTVGYRNPDGELYETTIPTVSLSVVSVLDGEETELRDLKPQVSLPGPPLWPWLVGGLTLAALVGGGGWWGLRWWRQRAQALSTPSPPPDPRPPHEIAYAELDRIAQLDLPRQGAFKAHYSLVTDCLRQYVEHRYQVPALDRTTSELLVGLRRARVKHDARSRLREVLEEADLVKFAKLRPPVDQAYQALDRARNIVQITRPAPPNEAESPTEPPAARSV